MEISTTVCKPIDSVIPSVKKKVEELFFLKGLIKWVVGVDVGTRAMLLWWLCLCPRKRKSTARVEMFGSRTQLRDDIEKLTAFHTEKSKRQMVNFVFQVDATQWRVWFEVGLKRLKRRKWSRFSAEGVVSIDDDSSDDMPNQCADRHISDPMRIIV